MIAVTVLLVVLVVLLSHKNINTESVVSEQVVSTIPMKIQDTVLPKNLGRYIPRIGEVQLVSGEIDKTQIIFAQKSVVASMHQIGISIDQFDSMIDQIVTEMGDDFTFGTAYSISSYSRAGGTYYAVGVPGKTQGSVSLFDSNRKLIKIHQENLGMNEAFAAGVGGVGIIDINNDNIDDIALVTIGHNCCGDNGVYLSLDETKDLPKDIYYNTHGSVGIMSQVGFVGDRYIESQVDNNADNSSDMYIGCNYKERELDLATYQLRDIPSAELAAHKLAFCKQYVQEPALFGALKEKVFRKLAEVKGFNIESVLRGDSLHVMQGTYDSFPIDNGYMAIVSYLNNGDSTSINRSLFVFRYAGTDKFQILNKKNLKGMVEPLELQDYLNEDATGKYYYVHYEIDSGAKVIRAFEESSIRSISNQSLEPVSCVQTDYVWSLEESVFIEQPAQKRKGSCN